MKIFKRLGKIVDVENLRFERVDIVKIFSVKVSAADFRIADVKIRGLNAAVKIFGAGLNFSELEKSELLPKVSDADSKIVDVQNSQFVPPEIFGSPIAII